VSLALLFFLGLSIITILAPSPPGLRAIASPLTAPDTPLPNARDLRERGEKGKESKIPIISLPARSRGHKVHSNKWLAIVPTIDTQKDVPVPSVMNSLVQSASAGSPSPACPEEAVAASAPDRNSDVQSPDRANAATPGATDRTGGKGCCFLHTFVKESVFFSESTWMEGTGKRNKKVSWNVNTCSKACGLTI
jgi:hypothetical protein